MSQVGNNVISLAEVRAARQQHRAPAEPAAPARPTSPPLHWRQSQRGNWWTREGGLHLVLYETRRGWRGRATAPSGQGWYVNMPPGVGTVAEAQAWAEGWLGMQCIAEAAETRV
jgi:hypothetical protein